MDGFGILYEAKRTSIRPQHDVMRRRVTSALEEIEEEVPCADVKVAGVRATMVVSVLVIVLEHNEMKKRTTPFRHRTWTS